MCVPTALFAGNCLVYVHHYSHAEMSSITILALLSAHMVDAYIAATLLRAAMV